MAWKSSPETLKKAQAIAHANRVGKPLPDIVKEKLRKKALTPERIAISTKNLPKYTKGNHPICGRTWSSEQRKKLLEAFKKRVPWNKNKRGVQVSHRKGKPYLKIRGKNHPNWQGGITSINKKIRSSLEYKLWREAIFKRDNWTCVWCGARSQSNTKVILNADHIKPFAHYPELRFSLDNGRTLCIDCHNKTETWRGRAKKFKKDESAGTNQ